LREQGSLIADEFLWWKDSAGYRLVAERSNPNAPSLLERAPRAEHVRPNGGERIEYSPAKRLDQLYKSFVSIKASDDVLRFTKLYGTLTEDGSRIGEEVSFVLKHAAAFRDWLAVPPNRKRPTESLGKTGRVFASLKARLAVDRKAYGLGDGIEPIFKSPQDNRIVCVDCHRRRDREAN
jgi:hypothetical protein